MSGCAMSGDWTQAPCGNSAATPSQVLHLFPDPEADLRDERKRQRQARAQTQTRCGACGKFARYPQDFTYDVLCVRCVDDPRPTIQEKVEQVRRWWWAHPNRWHRA